MSFQNFETTTKADLALQRQYGRMLESSGAEINVLGALSGFVSDGIAPSDNTMAVGPNHVIQMTNSATTSMRIWDKQGNVLANNINVTSLVGTNLGDPNIIYDYEADRFVFLVIGGSILRANITICVSESNDPLGSWLIYKVKAGGLLSSTFPDYPKLGVWGNAYFVTTNASGPIVYAIRRDKMLNAEDLTESRLFKLVDFPGGGIQTTSPVTVIGQNPVVPNSPAVVLRPFDAAWTASSTDVDAIEVYTLQIDWETPSNSSISEPLRLETAEYDFRLCSVDFNASTCIPQKGVNQKLDAIGAIIYDKAQYRNFGAYESIVCTHMTDGRDNGVASARWYELRRIAPGSWEIFQQGTYAPDDGVYRFMSSVSINEAGSIALGYNISSDVLNPDFAVTGRQQGDAPGEMTAVETVAQVGSGSQTSSNRYGDYNGMVSDPTDGSFWFTSNYTVPSGSWATLILHFEIVGGVVPVTLLTFNVSTNEKSVLLNWSTASEINNDHFEVERSADGLSFVSIGTVPAVARPGSLNRYSFGDTKPEKGIRYYRLKQVDKDGRTSFSSIKQILFNAVGPRVVLYPNPANEVVNLEFRSARPAVTRLSITNMAGQVVLTQPMNILQGDNKTALFVHTLVGGSYWISFELDGVMQRTKLMIER